jgi:hypothetical protein
MKQNEGKTIEFCANTQDQMFEFVTAVNRILSKQAVMQREHRSSAESESPKDNLPPSQPPSTRSAGKPTALVTGAAVTSASGDRVKLTDPFADSAVDPLARRQLLQKLSPKSKDTESPLRKVATLSAPPLGDHLWKTSNGNRSYDDDQEVKREDTSQAVVTKGLSSRNLTETGDTDTNGDGLTGDRTEYTGPTGTGTDYPSRDGTPVTSYEEQPLFNLDIRLKNGSQVMIPFYEGTDPEELAQAFAHQYDLSSVAASKLHVSPCFRVIVFHFRLDDGVFHASGRHSCEFGQGRGNEVGFCVSSFNSCAHSPHNFPVGFCCCVYCVLACSTARWHDNVPAE